MWFAPILVFAMVAAACGSADDFPIIPLVVAG